METRPTRWALVAIALGTVAGLVVAGIPLDAAWSSPPKFVADLAISAVQGLYVEPNVSEDWNYWNLTVSVTNLSPGVVDAAQVYFWFTSPITGPSFGENWTGAPIHSILLAYTSGYPPYTELLFNPMGHPQGISTIYSATAIRPDGTSIGEGFPPAGSPGMQVVSGTVFHFGYLPEMDWTGVELTMAYRGYPGNETTVVPYPTSA